MTTYTLVVADADWRNGILLAAILIDNEDGTTSGRTPRTKVIDLIRSFPSGAIRDAYGRVLTTAGYEHHSQARAGGYVDDPAARYIKLAPCTSNIGADQLFDDPVVAELSRSDSPYAL